MGFLRMTMKLTRKGIRAFFHETIPDYALELLPWLWIVLVAVVLSIAGAVIDMGGFDVPGWVWWLLIATSVFVAQFLTWNDMRKQRNEWRQQKLTHDKIDKLKEFRRQLIDLQNQLGPKQDRAEFGRWEERHENIRASVKEYLKKEFNETEEYLFNDIGLFDVKVLFGEDLAKMELDYLKRRSIIGRDHQWLETMMIDYLRDRRRLYPLDDPPAAPPKG